MPSLLILIFSVLIQYEERSIERIQSFAFLCNATFSPLAYLLTNSNNFLICLPDESRISWMRITSYRRIIYKQKTEEKKK